MADTKTAYITLDNLTRYNNNIKATYETIANVALKADDNKVVHLDGAETITGVKTFSSAIVGDLTGNAGTADKLKTAVNINGTSFDGSADITTDLWGAARNVTVADADATNTGASVSVNGSEDVTLKLPATIKAALNGNADTATLAETATKSVQDGDGNVIAETYLKSASISGATDEEIDALFN